MDIKDYFWTVSSKGQLNKIRAILEKQGKTQTWLADQLGLEFLTVTRYVNNHRQPSLETLERIARALKVPGKDLINF
jgi:putative transcriptional regulator